MSSEDRVAWRPDPTTRARARLTRFLEFTGTESLEALQRRSVEDVAWFTGELARFLDIPFDPPYTRVLDLSRGRPWPRWFVDGGLNISNACVDRHQGTPTWSSVAVIWEGEEGVTRSLTYAELAAAIRRCAAGLRSLGLGRGDAVGIHLPMMPETVIALLAVARIGGIAVPLFSGFGPGAIASRLSDVRARAVVTCDGFPRRGRPVPAQATAAEAIERCPSVEHVIVVSRSTPAPSAPLGRSAGPESRAVHQVTWEALLTLGQQAGHDPGIEPTGTEDPLLVLYSSGTTGQPKGILHSHCGFPIKAAQDMAFGTDVGPGSRIAWVTDIGWMMGPWLIYGATLLGATMVLYDGAPDFPGPDRLWAFCERHRVEILGISPTLVRSLMVHGDHPVARHDLASLRILASTGEPWNPDPWWWLFKTVGRERVPIINYSGGTEISGGIVMGNPLLPVTPCGFAAPCPGIAADVVDDAARPVRGAVGELVIRQPWVGQARGFWNDPDRYLATYWSRWPDLWVHGDWARIDPDGQWYILGRSDDTLKVAGRRVGPAEIESVLVSHPLVAEAAAIGVPDETRGTTIVAFCVLTGSDSGSPDLAAQLRDLVGAELGRPLRPDQVHFVPALPKTRNAKVMRRVIRAAYLGEDPGDVTALENPAAVDAVRRTAPTAA